ncbi:hypothetical protein L0P50_07325 [Lawsonibacter sp. DFI.6.74]|nr:hypothetical protein [Lawsonibacter sp. DFI.6.74]MCG4773221.1 hypothetical protein [Lawsonibacter sp. DFI.5.51]
MRKFVEPDVADNPLYHDTWKLLKKYRDVVWSLELSVQHVRTKFEIEYGTSIEDFLDSVYLAGADLAGSDIEHHAKCIERSHKMLKLLDSAIELLRTKHKNGEAYYWLLYYSFLSPQQLKNVEEIIETLICQQRLSPQFRHEDVHGLILGNSMDLAYQILTSTGGRKHDFFMLDGSYEHFLYLTNDHQGEVILALLCDPGKTAELDRILLQGLTARQPGLAIEHDGISPDGSPVLFGYFCDLPRIARFNTSLELSERPGTLICFDFQAEVLRSYCGSRMRFQTIDFTKFEGRLFP